jgi:glutathione S-transferase
MLTLFGNLDSGNVHKVQMILHLRAIAFRRVDVRQDRGQPRDPRFLALNPMGKVPAVRFEDGDMLSDSGALLFYFAQGTPLWPGDPRRQAEVLRWMFFEQYSHEPALAVLRYLVRFAGGAPPAPERIAELTRQCRQVLDVLEGHLAGRDFMLGATPTIADIALYPYTRLGGEIGMAAEVRPALARWLGRMEDAPCHLPVYADAAAEVIDFEVYFATPPRILPRP